MRWRGGRRSQNIEDRRGMRVSRGIAGGGIGAVILLVAALFFGVDPSIVLQNGPAFEDMTYSPQGQPPTAGGELPEFVSVVLADTEDTWHAIFQELGGTYQEPTMVLFTGAVQSACGFAQAAVGPFYCPGDQRVYLDLSFFEELRTRFGAPGDFAQAYVIAHEIGHHVQTLLGITQEVNRLRGQVSQVEANDLSVRVELQADCFAGLWAHRAQQARQILEEGDIEEGLNAASAIGDDRLQRESRGYVSPDSFTHGSSAQRVHWFERGLASGDPASCDTFSADRL
jgi:uncharacterized protein